MIALRVDTANGWLTPYLNGFCLLEGFPKGYMLCRTSGQGPAADDCMCDD